MKLFAEKVYMLRNDAALCGCAYLFLFWLLGQQIYRLVNVAITTCAIFVFHPSLFGVAKIELVPDQFDEVSHLTPDPFIAARIRF